MLHLPPCRPVVGTPFLDQDRRSLIEALLVEQVLQAMLRRPLTHLVTPFSASYRSTQSRSSPLAATPVRIFDEKNGKLDGAHLQRNRAGATVYKQREEGGEGIVIGRGRGIGRRRGIGRGIGREI